MSEITKQYYCRLCGVEIVPSNRVGSHLITKSTNWVKGDVKCVTKDGKVEDAKKQARQCNLLCWECEQKIKLWEDERLLVFRSEDSRPTQSCEEQQGLVGYGYNNEYIVLACLADLLRCSWSDFPLYSGVRLGEKHERRITEIISNGKIDDFSEYPVMLGRFNSESKIVDQVAQAPQRRKFEGVNFYCSTSLSGWIWMMKVDQRPFEPLEEWFLSEKDGTKVANFGNVMKSPFLMSVYRTALAITRNKRS